MKVAGKPIVHCVITHFDEITLELCQEKLRKQTFPLAHIDVVTGVAPAASAFNQALDIAHAAGADILVHLAADVIVCATAVERLIKTIDLDKHYAVVAQGFDVFNGECSSMGLWALNMRAINKRFRFNDVYKMDMDFCERIEAETGLKRIKTNSIYNLGYHHPVWTPHEIFMKFRYNSAKYTTKILRLHEKYFKSALTLNPDNKTLQIGLVALKRGAAEANINSGPDRKAYALEFEAIKKGFNLVGNEFYAVHADMIELGAELLGASPQSVIPAAQNFF